MYILGLDITPWVIICQVRFYISVSMLYLPQLKTVMKFHSSNPSVESSYLRVLSISLSVPDGEYNLMETSPRLLWTKLIVKITCSKRFGISCLLSSSSRARHSVALIGILIAPAFAGMFLEEEEISRFSNKFEHFLDMQRDLSINIQWPFVQDVNRLKRYGNIR